MRATRTAIMVNTYFFVHPVLLHISLTLLLNVPFYSKYQRFRVSREDLFVLLPTNKFKLVAWLWFWNQTISRAGGASMMILFKLLNWSMDCPILLKMSHFVVPTSGTRSMDWMELFFRNQDLTFYVYML